MQASEIQTLLESHGVPTDKAKAAAVVVAREMSLCDATIERSPEDQAAITAAWELIKQSE
jgi:hypothetical protein